MTDLELLELAAKAAELTVWVGQWPQDDMLFAVPKTASGNVTGVEWNPLAYDSDALRLAVKLNLHEAIKFAHRLVDDKTDIYSATRRAIVRAAAEIGKTK